MILYFVNFSVNILFSIWTVILSAMSTTFLSSSLYFLCFFIFPYFFSVSVEKNIIIFLAYLEVDYINRFFFPSNFELNWILGYSLLGHSVFFSMHCYIQLLTFCLGYCHTCSWVILIYIISHLLRCSCLVLISKLY